MCSNERTMSNQGSGPDQPGQFTNARPIRRHAPTRARPALTLALSQRTGRGDRKVPRLPPSFPLPSPPSLLPSFPPSPPPVLALLPLLPLLPLLALLALPPSLPSLPSSPPSPAPPTPSRPCPLPLLPLPLLLLPVLALLPLPSPSPPIPSYSLAPVRRGEGKGEGSGPVRSVRSLALYGIGIGVGGTLSGCTQDDRSKNMNSSAFSWADRSLSWSSQSGTACSGWEVHAAAADRRADR